VTPIDVKDLTSRYVAAWNEPDPARRRQAIRELWAEDGIHVLQPPAEFRQAAAGLEILILGPDGRIEADYQFIEA
jgi:hypothetical protein